MIEACQPADEARFAAFRRIHQVGQQLPRVRNVIERMRPKVVIRGHAHWDQPLAELANGAQVLNVDSRVVVLSAIGPRV